MMTLLLGAVAAEASCQSEWCVYQRQLDDREREAAARAAYEADPDDPEALADLVSELDGVLSRERHIARFESRYTWREAPDLDALEAVVDAERRVLSARLLELRADDPRAWCAHARRLDDPARRLELLTGRLADGGDDAVLVACLARELAAQDRRDEAIGLLRSFLDASPDPVAFQALRSIHLGDSLAARLPAEDRAAIRALIEEQARRRPDDLQAQLDLLYHLRGHHDCAEDQERAAALGLGLLERPLSGSDHHRVCSALGYTDRPASRECWTRLADAPLPDDDPETAERYRAGARTTLALQAGRAGDWERFQALAGRLAPDAYWTAWRDVLARDTAWCPRFLAAWKRDGGGADASGVKTVLSSLRTCGADALARQLVEEHNLLRPDGTDPTRNELSIHSMRRGPSPSVPLDRPPIDRALPDLRSLRSLGERVDGELLAELEAWAAEEPEAFSPALRVALVHEQQGRPDAALASWRHLLSIWPDDLDLQVAYGAFGLRLDLPEAVREAARRLLGDPEANPRHRAEGHYLLGRLAHRDGRWDEASDHLAVYFLERLRFTGCVAIETCDRALYQLFWEAADFEACDRYHRARAEAVAAFERRRDRLEPLPDDVPRILTDRRRPEPARPWPQVFSLDCASPRALARHERRLEELRASDPYGVETARLEELLELGRTARPCTDSELPDPDTLLPDDALLGLSWDLRAVN